MDISNIKRSFIVIIGIILIVLIILFLTTVIMVKQDNMDFRNPVILRENPTVTYSVGEAEYLRENSSKWKAIEIGLVLKEGTSIRTGFDGIVDIRFSNGTAMRITEDSILNLDDVSLRTINVNLNKGGIISKFTKLFSNQKYSINTPSIVAGIRGTELIVNTNSKGTSIVGMSGITEIYNPLFPEKRILLGFQTKSEIAADQAPSDPEALTMEEVSSFRNMLDSINTNKVLLLGEAIQFKPDTADILDESRIELEKLAKKMRWRFFKIEIRGHTADIGDAGSQYSLSLERAESIKKYLISQKIKNKRLLVRGYGGSKPIATNNNPEGRAKNRRVEFVVIE